MKKIVIIIFIFIIGLSVTAADDNIKGKSSWGDNSDVFTKGFENQKAVSDNKLKETVKMLKDRALTKKQKKLREQVKPLSPLPDEEYLKEFARSQSNEDELSQTHTVMIPMQAYSDSGVWIQPGYYKLSCRKLGENNYVLDLSQGNTRVMSVEAKQTQQDLEQDTISFCNAEIIDNGRIRLVYGSIDLNLVGYIYFK